MFEFLWLIPAIPFFSALFLVLFGANLPRRIVAHCGAGSICLSALLTIIIGMRFLVSPPADHAFIKELWTWFSVGELQAMIALRLDALSLVFIFVITFVGFLIHLYSTEFMEEEQGYSRFFAYMNLFVGSMLTLVLADNLLLMYLGWEGVGLCSYLLIGFWFRDPVNGRAARKAFIVTRVGDTAMAIGLFLLVYHIGSLNIQMVLSSATELWPQGSSIPVLIAALLLGGAVGKSAQLPLQTWLPDAMAGPTPVSALIHAATMVTAGVYLIARTHVLFALAPVVQTAVALIGLATLLIAGFAALTQVDIKRVLAYSTISQIGYMFLALGVGAWSAAIFHFMTHAFFKALLFLAAGVVINAMHHEHNMFKMGGLKKFMPVAFWTFLIGAASLASLPLVTAGFYSKDAILWYAWTGANGSSWLWIGGLFGALLTAMYSFRMVFVTFYGKNNKKPGHPAGWRMQYPLIILAALSILSGFLQTPESLGHITVFSRFLQSVLPAAETAPESLSRELIAQIIAAILAFAGLYAAYILYLKRPKTREKWLANPILQRLQKFFFSGWGFDSLYHFLFVAPFVWLANINKNDFFDKFYNGLVLFFRYLYMLLSETQNGRLRRYAAGIVVGAVITLTLVFFL